MESLRGHVLIAAPRLADGNFFRSVVLIVQHNKEGAFGLVINRPSRNRVADIWNALGVEDCPVDAPLFIGGPCEGPIMALHNEPAHSEDEVLPGVHFCTHKEPLDELVSRGASPLKVIKDYSGWGPGQLEAEMEMGGWLTLPATSEIVFGDPDEVWTAVTRHVNADILTQGSRIKHVPKDASMN